MSRPPCRHRPAQPFRPFFLLAALDAIVGVGVWLPGLDTVAVQGVPVSTWHRDELLFGMIPAVLAGFVLTALPRWTGRPSLPTASLAILVGMWLAGRAAHLAGSAWSRPLSAAFLLGLAFAVTRQVVAARDTRNIKVALLLALLAAAAGHPDGGVGLLPAGGGPRIGLATILGLVLVIGGRVTPALTGACLEADGRAYRRPRPSRRGEALAAVLAGVALGAWALVPDAGATAIVAIGACGAQGWRLAQWRGWQVRGSPAILALHLAYGWIPVGFGLAAARGLDPGLIGEHAVIHAWAVGAIGLMCLAVMASMIRRRNRIAFAPSAVMSASLACGLGAAAVRLLAEGPGFDGRPLWLALAALAWIAAFVLFLVAFRAELLWPGPKAP